MSLRIVLVACLVLLGAWSVVVPIFEAPDEPDHWAYARHVHDTGRLPIYSSEFVEGVSPPLYYLLVAPLAVWSGAPPPHSLTHPALDRQPVRRPWYFVHRTGDLARYWPIRAARLLTALVSLLAVYFTWHAAKEATGCETTGTLAAALLAFLPQFTFRGMNVSNDALVAAAGAGCSYLLTALVRRGFSWRLGSTAACVWAAALLSKINALALGVPLALALLSESGRPSVRMRRLAVLGVSLVLVAPWLAWNVTKYGDVLGRNAMLTVAPGLVPALPPGWDYFLGSFARQLARSSVGLFGWMNVPMQDWIYALYGVLALGSLLGLALRVWQRPADRRLLCLLAAGPVVGLALVVYFNRVIHAQAQGRYLFPVLGAAAVLVAMGLEALPGWSRPKMVALSAVLAVVNVGVLATSVRQAYWPPSAREFSTRSRVLAPDQAAGQGNGPLTIHAARPQITLRLDEGDVRDYSFLEFSLASACPGRQVMGFVSLVGSPQARVDFEWSSDGALHRILVPLFVHHGWNENVRALRIGFFSNKRVERQCLDTPIEVHTIRLTGGLDEPRASRAGHS